ncbi:MAG: FHA domain-containing protein [Gemmataceae bacterium]|nr:FHA domain-containing protein [Gemmataceae bacterium]
MSFYRLIFYHAMLGGWAAFFGWLVSEVFLLRRSGDLGTLPVFFTSALVGAAIGAGIALVTAVANGHFKGVVVRSVFCLAGGFAGGAMGGLIGNVIYSVLPYSIVRVLGWMLMGLGIGGVEGLFDRSVKKIRNGLIGGAIGGFLGGLCFDPVVRFVGGNMSGRAIAFVILGMCIGLFIGLAQIILREAWLTVEQGFRPGRQFVLNIPVTILGTSEKAQLSFIAYGAKGVEPIHLRIEQQPDGHFLVRDNGSRTGTFVNGRRVQEEVLHHDDVIQLGPNLVRFREAVRHVSADGGARRRPQPAVALPEATPIMATPPPVPAPGAIKSGPPPVPAPASGAIKPGPARAPVAQQVAIQPAAAAPPAPKPASAGPRGKPCPKCAKPGTPIPGTGHHLCMSCDLKY